MEFKNLYHLRKVAEAQAKPCNFCYKPATSVLITSDGKSDFFYTCDSHLKDKQFATPIYDEEYNKAKQEKENIDKEIKALKLKWDEQNRYKGWDNLISKFNSKDKDKEKDSKDKDKAKESTPESKINELNSKLSNHQDVLSKPPRVYQLNNSIYKIRTNKKVQKFQNQQNNSLMNKLTNDSFFPSIPKGSPQ